MSEFSIEFANRVESLRKEGESFETFCPRVGVSYNNLRRWKRGEHDVNKKLAEVVARRTGCNLEWLLTGKGQPYEESKGEGEPVEADGDGPARVIGLSATSRVMTDADIAALIESYIVKSGLSIEESGRLADLVRRGLSDPKYRQRILEFHSFLEFTKNREGT